MNLKIMTTKEQKRLLGNLVIKLTSDVEDGEIMDTKVEIGDHYLCTIAGINIDTFVASLNSIIIKFRI
jgi:hypothetical protein